LVKGDRDLYLTKLVGPIDEEGFGQLTVFIFGIEVVYD
jgi:hypothetical protein